MLNYNKNMKFKFYYYIFLFFIFIFFIFFSEFLLRLYGLGTPVIYDTNISYRYAPKPNQSVTRFKGSRVTINKDGLRATKDWDNKNNHKLLFFGDSVTYGGSYIDDKNIFSELTCNFLNNKSHFNYLCGNAGVNAYGVDNIKNRILFGKIKNEQWIIVTLIPDDGYRSLQNIMSIPAFLDEPRFFPAIQEILLNFFWKANIYLRENYRPNISYNKEEDNVIFKESFINLKNALMNETKNKKKVLVILHPSKKEVIHNKESKEYLLMKSIFQDEKEKIILLDMFPIIRLQSTKNIYYDDVHLDKDGHTVFAQKLSDIIRKYDKSY